MIVTDGQFVAIMLPIHFVCLLRHKSKYNAVWQSYYKCQSGVQFILLHGIKVHSVERFTSSKASDISIWIHTNCGTRIRCFCCHLDGRWLETNKLIIRVLHFCCHLSNCMIFIIIRLTCILWSRVRLPVGGVDYDSMRDCVYAGYAVYARDSIGKLITLDTHVPLSLSSIIW